MSTKDQCNSLISKSLNPNHLQKTISWTKYKKCKFLKRNQIQKSNSSYKYLQPMTLSIRIYLINRFISMKIKSSYLPSPWILINLIGSKTKIYARPGLKNFSLKNPSSLSPKSDQSFLLYFFTHFLLSYFLFLITKFLIYPKNLITTLFINKHPLTNNQRFSTKTHGNHIVN